MDIHLRKGEPHDLTTLEHIEKVCFPLYQQSSRRSLGLSLRSPHQEVWFAEAAGKPAGALVVHYHKKSLRIFSIAVLGEYQGGGIGQQLIQLAINIATSKRMNRLSLEAEADNLKLIKWYKKFGFETQELIKDYYEPDRDAFRMILELEPDDSSGKLSNLIIVDEPAKWKLKIENAEIMSSDDYTSNKGDVASRKVRVFNLCNSYRYQSLGYYVSLLASARDHRAIPNATTIRDFRDVHVVRSLADDIDEFIQKTLSDIREDHFELRIYFGQSVRPEFEKLAAKLYQMFEAPLLKVQFQRQSKWLIRRIQPLSMDRIEPSEMERLQGMANRYFASKRFHRAKLKNIRYYLGILVNREEEHPPSDARALKKLTAAAEKYNIWPEFITRDDYNKLYEFDALFIRETTNVNDHTYQFSRKAYAEGLVVIDDPWSILRCSNKIYLNERLRNNSISTPETVVFSKRNNDALSVLSLKYPLILKQPDSAFSVGVMKVNNEQELHSALQQLFKQSDLIIAQEFLPSDYDWRIGVLDNQLLFACKYFMAKGHWQIYNWKETGKEQAGDAETISVAEVPPRIAQVALKAAALMGDGLYGVDIKEINGKAYVIEVNDNPNIDSGIEDKVEGNLIYEKIIRSIIHRIEVSRNISRFVSSEPDL